MDWIPVGKLTKPHGLKGELKFRPWITDPEIIQSYRQGRLSGEDSEPTAITIERLRQQGGKWILKPEACHSIGQAETIAGATLEIPRSDFPPLPPGEYYWFQIEGLKVYEDTGQYFGTIEEIIETGSNDVYVVRDGGRELLLPMIDPVVQSIDLEQGTLIFHRVEGLIEDDPV